MKVKDLKVPEIKAELEKLEKPLEEYKGLNKPELIIYAQQFIKEEEEKSDKLKPYEGKDSEEMIKAICLKDYKTGMKKGQEYEVTKATAHILRFKGLIK